MKVVFISYFFKPFKGVGAQRISYWADNAWKFDIDVEVVTSIRQEIEPEYPVHLLENTRRKRLLSSLIKDEGYSWYLDLKKFLSKHSFGNVEAFVISGGPFMHFEIAKDLKIKYPSSKVILDYRDPFGNNPRFNDGFPKKSIKQYFEKRFNKFADSIITVNSYCAALINAEQKIELIDNGYDETVLRQVNTDEGLNKNTLILAGKFYINNDEKPLQEVVKQNRNLVLYHYGSESNALTYSDEDQILYGGFLPYPEMLRKIVKSEIGIVYTNGEPYESTTKVFDYMALNKKILLITEGKKNTGRLQQITEKYPNIVWANNNSEDIEKAINKLLNLTVELFDSSQFTREESLKKLVKIIR